MVLPHQEGHSGLDSEVDRGSAGPLSRGLLSLAAGQRVPITYQKVHPQGSCEVMTFVSFPYSPKRVKVCSKKTPVDAQALKKKVSKVTCDPAVRAILGSLLLYITSHKDGPQRPPPTKREECGDSQASRKPEPQDASRRPTRFQLLQAKFMGTGREPYLKKTREVGRLIFKDKQGPGKSVVTATINKLLEKTQEGTGTSARGQEPLCGDKPRWGLPTGKNTVKNILKKFLAAEEKEAEEKRLREMPPAERSKAPRGLLPKIVGKKGSVLSKLREKFEQSSCLCSEASVLLIHMEERKKKNLQRKKMHRPEARVLCTATMASSCIRMPLAHFLACSAEPMLAFSIATIVCGPRSWLSHCAKIRHSDLRRMPPKETGRSLNAEEMVPGGNKTPGKELPHEEPAQPLILQAMPPSLKTASLSAGPQCTPEPAASPASQRGEALPGLEPKLSSLGSASPGHPGVSGGDRMGGPQAGNTTDDNQGVKEAMAGPHSGPAGEGAEEAPQVDLMVCSSEDEMERVISDSEQDLLFAVQKNFPEPTVAEHIPPLNTPTAQAARSTQLAFEPPQVTVRLPVVHELPLLPVMLQKTSDSEGPQSRVLGGESVVANARALFPTTTESKSTSVSTIGVNESAGAPRGLSTPPQPDSQADLSLTPPRGAVSIDRDIPEAAPALKPQASPTGGKEDRGSFGNSKELKNHENISGEGVPELSYKKYNLPEAEEMPICDKGTSSRHSMASENRLRGDGHSAPGSRQVPPPNGGNSAGIPTLLVAPSQDWTRPEHVTTIEKNILSEQAECRGPPLPESAQPLPVAEGRASHGLGENRPVSLNESTEPRIKAPRRETATEVTKSHPAPAPGNALNPENNTHEKWDILHEGGCSSSPTGRSLIAEDLGHEPTGYLFLSPDGFLKHPSSRATENHVCKGLEQNLPVTLESLTTVPQEAAGPPHMPGEPGVGLSNKVAASKGNAVVGSRNTVAAQAGPQGNNTKSPVPASSHPTLQGSGGEELPCRNVDKPPSSSEKKQAEDEKLVTSEKLLPAGAGVAHQFPSVPLTVEEEQQVVRAPQKCPDLQAPLPPASSCTQAGILEETEGRERPWPQAGLGRGEEGVSGTVGPKGPGQKGVAPSDPEEIKPGERSRLQAVLGGREQGVSGTVGLKGPGQKGVAPSDPEEIKPGERSRLQAVLGKGVAPSDPEEIKPGERSRLQAVLGGREQGVSGTVGLKGPGQKGVAPSDPEEIKPGERSRLQAVLGGGEEGVSGTVGLKGPGQKGVAPSDPEEIKPGERSRLQAVLGGREQGVSGTVGLKGPGQKGVAPSDPEEIKPGERSRLQAVLGGGEEGVSGTVGPKGPGQKEAPSSSQKTSLCVSEEAQTLHGSDAVTTEVETPSQHAEKGTKHPPGEWVWTAEDPSEQHDVHTEENQAPPFPERLEHLAQAQAGRMAPHNLVQPTGNSTAVASGKSQSPAPRGAQGTPGVPQREEEHHREVAKSQTSSRPDQAQGPEVLTAEPGICQTPGAPAQVAPPDSSGEGRSTLDLECQRRSAQFAKYKAQSFKDQKSFDLSFRRKIIRTNQ
ncbi:collagen alpha-1(I) chain-like [Pteronotus mesoamericanus]|uniref:collagen alpha-1(I) chain-like n=1 Tax=Pteronotus mesoamericanus TaxID=1884717 RepID=UPI0023EB5D77|nr:collagen alpha-1(I) chain-like [Pteronotus parnellii mesoamericanus]